MKEITMAISERLYARLSIYAEDNGISVGEALAQIVAAKVKEDSNAKQ